MGYSLLYRKKGAQATVDTCRELGIAVLAYFPLAMGVLTGKWKSKDLYLQRARHRGPRVFPAGDGRAYWQVEEQGSILAESSASRSSRISRWRWACLLASGRARSSTR